MIDTTPSNPDTAMATKNIANAVFVLVFCMKLDEIVSFYPFCEDNKEKTIRKNESKTYCFIGFILLLLQTFYFSLYFLNGSRAL